MPKVIQREKKRKMSLTGCSGAVVLLPRADGRMGAISRWATELLPRKHEREKARRKNEGGHLQQKKQFSLFRVFYFSCFRGEDFSRSFVYPSVSDIL